MRVYPLPGAGLVVRAGDLIAVCADAGPETDALVALVQRAAADGAGGDPVGRLAGQLGADGVPCAVAGRVTDRTASVLVRGAASAEIIGAQERLHLHGPVLTHRTVDGPLRTVRLTLPDHGAPDRRTALEAGVVSGAGLLAEIVQPFEQLRRPDRSAPFEANILLPGHAEAPPAVPPPSADDAATRPLVEGVYCRDDHFNDPDQRYCQICGISMAQLTQVSRLGPRPPLGLLLLDDGSTLRLDTDYVVGREPDSDRDVVAARARALRISGPVSGVSRRHLRIRLVGWRVEVVDLHSANGTSVLHRGAADPERLTPGVPVMIAPGARVDVGRRWLRYESHRNP